MVITEISMIHHVAIVLILLWFLNSYNCCHSVLYFISLIYLYQIHERYIMRLRRKLQYEGRKAANQRRVLTDSETVRWLNYAVEKMWPICMENIISQRIFLAIIPWFLQKYKPWTVKRAVVQHLYLGRTPPLFTDIRVLHDSTEDDHLVLELGLNFLTADDMSAILAAKLRKRLGFGIVAKMHLTGMHVEGRVLVGVKFLRSWPFIGRLRVCFAEPPYFQMTVKPLFNHGLDVTELPGIAGWLDKLLAIAFEETLVEPNMLVVDLEKFVSPEPETWYSIDVKEPLAYAKLEVLEAAELKASDLNGLSDPYVKGHLGQYRFKTQVQRKTLTPKWQEEFKVPIISWDAQNVLEFEVLDKDRFSEDDVLGNCSVNLNELRDGYRHDMWLALENVKLGRLHLAITVVEANEKVEDLSESQISEESKSGSEKLASLDNDKASQTPDSSEKPKPIADAYEAIDVEGQKQTGIWVHHPGSEVSQTWEPRKGKNRLSESEILSVDTPKSSLVNDSSSSDNDNKGDHKGKRGNFLQRGFDKIFHKHEGDEHHQVKKSRDPDSPSLRTNVKASHIKNVDLNVVFDDDVSGPLSLDGNKLGGGSSNDGSGADKHDMKDKAKHMFRNARNSARRFKDSFKKGSKKNMDAPNAGGESDFSDDDNSVTSSLNDRSIKGVPIGERSLSRSNNEEGEVKEDSGLVTDPPKGSFEMSDPKSLNGVGSSKEDKEFPLESPRKKTLSDM